MLKVSYHTRCNNDTGDIYKQTISMPLETFEKLKARVDNEIKNEYPLKDEYVFTSGYETFLKPLELKKNIICYLTLTQTRFLNMYFHSDYKTDRNTCIIIRK